MLPHIPNHLILLTAFLAFLTQAQDSSYKPTCKSYPGTADWPSAAEWARLGESLGGGDGGGGGRLLRPSPPGAVCHPGQDAYNEIACADVEARWNSYELHVDDPVSVVWSNFANDSCLPDPAYLCSGDGYPAYVVNATEPEHVKIGIDFGLLPSSFSCRRPVCSWCLGIDWGYSEEESCEAYCEKHRA